MKDSLLGLADGWNSDFFTHFMNELSLQKIRDGLESSVRMIRKSGSVVGISGKFVQHEEWIQISQFSSTNRTSDLGSTTLALPNTEKNLLDRFSGI